MQAQRSFLPFKQLLGVTRATLIIRRELAPAKCVDMAGNSRGHGIANTAPLCALLITTSKVPTYTYHGYQNNLRWPATPRCEFHHKLLKHCNGGVQTVPRGSTYGHSAVTNQTLMYSGIGGLIFVMHIVIVVNCRVEPGGHHHQGHRRQWLLQLCLRPPHSSAGP